MAGVRLNTCGNLQHIIDGKRFIHHDLIDDGWLTDS